jgi:anti-sigma factor RsiW
MSEKDQELLAAYVDGVSELTAEERRAVEERLGDDPALRAEEAETRALIGRLRELPPGGDAPAGEPDWAALERSILGAVGPDVPRPWWRRLGWRWALPAAALAAAAAILALVVRTPAAPATQDPPAVALPRPAPDPAVAPGAAPAPATPPGDTVALWLDGEDVEVELAADALLEVPWESDRDQQLDDLLPASDLAWVDELAAEELERAEALLDDPELKLPMQRKRG